MRNISYAFYILHKFFFPGTASQYAASAGVLFAVCIVQLHSHEPIRV